MKKLFFLSFIIITGALHCYAQFSRYVIQLKDKAGTPYSINNPLQFLTQRAIDRRLRYSIAIDSTDLPVTPAYLDSIRLSGTVSILNVSKWFNQVCIQTTDAAALSKINALPFVVASAPIAARFEGIYDPVNKQLDPEGFPVPLGSPTPVIENVKDYYSYGQSYAQVNLHDGEFLHNHGFRGQDMIIAITDAGFYHYLNLPTFDSVNNNGQVLGTWDFVANKASVNEEYAHGMNCFSTIAANMPGLFMGTAPKSSFYLYRTEDVSSEYPIEMQNWLAAAEKADSLGVDIISVSLGYNTFDNSIFNYTYNDLNGNSTIIAKAANVAARKGLLIAAAAGNSGDEPWHYIETPGDADSVLSVGAVDSNGIVASFSSYGPNSNGQTKPDVAADGSNAIVANQVTGLPSPNSGTSFACPIMAGLTTCLWQAFPEVNNMSIIDVLHKASNNSATPDDRIGYGIPDMKKAFVMLIKKLHTKDATVADCKATLKWSAKSASDMVFIVERKLSSDVSYKMIDTLTTAGSFANNNFSYTDDLSILPASSTISYRIKMNIAADTSFYLDSATLNFPSTCTQITPEEKILVSPNPVTDNLSVMVTRNEAVLVSVVLYTANGQQIVAFSKQQASGSNTYTIPMKKLSSGVYYVSVFIDNKKQFTKQILR